MAFKQRIKHFISVLLGKDILIRRQIKIYYEYLGSQYGGFAVATSKLSEKDNVICYSFGVGEDISFDLEMIDKYNATVYAFDPTPKSIKYLQKQILPDKFKFYKYALSNIDGELKFYLPENPNYVSCSLVRNNSDKFILVDSRKLSTIMNELRHKKIDVLKMDIEGAEFDVIDEIIESRIEFEQLCVEIHHRFFENGIDLVKKMIRRLNENGYKIFWVSDNGEEVSFIKR